MECASAGEYCYSTASVFLGRRPRGRPPQSGNDDAQAPPRDVFHRFIDRSGHGQYADLREGARDHS